MLAAEVRARIDPPAFERHGLRANLARQRGEARHSFRRVAACREDHGSARELAAACGEGLVRDAALQPLAQGEGDEARLPAVGPRHRDGEGPAAFGFGGDRRVGA